MSNATQGWYWLAAGVLALGLNGVYHDGGSEWAHQVVDRAIDRTVAMVPERAQELMQRVRMAADRENERASSRWSQDMSHWQAQVTRVDSMRARQNVRLARMNVHHAMNVQVANAHLTQACSHVQVEVPAVSIPEINIPRIDVPQINIPRVSIPAVHLESVSVPRIDISPVVVTPDIHIDSDSDGDDGPI